MNEISTAVAGRIYHPLRRSALDQPMHMGASTPASARMPAGMAQMPARPDKDRGVRRHTLGRPREDACCSSPPLLPAAAARTISGDQAARHAVVEGLAVLVVDPAAARGGQGHGSEGAAVDRAKCRPSLQQAPARQLELTASI